MLRVSCLDFHTPKSKAKVSPARSTAFDILLRVDRHAAYASELLHADLAGELSAVDHRLATELVMGVLRWRGILDREIAAACSQALEKLDLEVLAALRLGVYQLRFLERVPARAAIHESVELVKRARKRSAAPLVNAVLRKLSGKSPTLHSFALSAKSADVATAAELASTYSHPEWLVQRWVREYGFKAARLICEYHQHRAPTAIRVLDAQAEEELLKEGVELTPGRLVGSARIVVSGDVTQTTAFRKRTVVVLDEASQLIALLAGYGERILDCCAAPGGKTAIMAERNPSSAVLAVELHPHRARLLRKLVGASNVQVISADARLLPVKKSFDVILVDAPCSGTGTLARNPDIKWRLQPEDIFALQTRQVGILRAAAEQLAPGGRLLYSTCSLEREEGEDVVARVLEESSSIRLMEANRELRPLEEQGELVESLSESLTQGPYLRTIPGIQHCDGFFAAILEKL